MQKQVLMLCFTIFSTILFAQTRKDIDVDHMLRGYIYAQSSLEDDDAIGGFGGSDNAPQKIKSQQFKDEKGLFLEIDTSKVVAFGKEYNGYKLYIGNKSDSVVKLSASDSRLYVIAEVYHDNKWQAIEYLPSSWCGNSYHSVYLNKNECWSFTIPKITGEIKTKLRYRLMIGKDKYVYSNEIDTSFNALQLTNKNPRKPKNIMDPYED